ncbi:hypothetical protein AZF37_01060 [endosymbiont 'TC1' of Trimyema compressum]|uniref:hypothetical protein n=1 Tax=endosymbiont 'TC1' of Trimyema compressum TaxID=243899 RepID=UPI0007F10384|nr:hypothetical protein [endosymbiont 'TC1' of Trimyema compressum]AMP19958.1 hypothetical protein AZF37_01060 [endosymbiont 'TC1' of Trimyema compressum]
MSRPVDTDITVADLETLTSLSIYGPYKMGSTEPRVKSLEGLQYAVNLSMLNISNGDLSNPNSISAIANLVKLESLDLSFSNVTSDSLRYLVNLTKFKFFKSLL